MTTIRLRHLSLPEAEEAIVALWVCLEEYDIPTPHIDFRFEAPGHATLSLRIDSQWHQIVKHRIAGSIANSRLSDLRLETEDRGSVRSPTTDRGLMRAIRGRDGRHTSPQSADGEDALHGKGPATRIGLDPLMAVDTTTGRNIH